MNKAERLVFSKAIETYGSDEQMRIAQEECAELIQAISKYHRTIKSSKKMNDRRYMERVLKNLKEEIADVSIMLDQLQMMFEFTNKELSEVRTSKIERLSAALEAHNAV